MKNFIKTAMAILLLSNSLYAISATINFNPSTTTIFLGNTFNVDVVISDLGNGSAPSLGAFDFDVNYDPTVLSFSGGIFGTGLDLFGLGSISGVTPGATSVNFFEISLDSEIDLNALQPDSFVLVSLAFNAIAVGNSQLSFGINDFADGAGDRLLINGIPGNALVSSASSVPEPAGVWLMGLGSVFFYIVKLRKITNENT